MLTTIYLHLLTKKTYLTEFNDCKIFKIVWQHNSFALPEPSIFGLLPPLNRFTLPDTRSYH